ncbi:MAG: right-handed parallel beta-helix repeat-containing protein [Chloroflexi bacterium]|nr:right-handed parallel beta-helix repeat-containing protein [Chloroflexota bacterium]
MKATVIRRSPVALAILLILTLAVSLATPAPVAASTVTAVTVSIAETQADPTGITNPDYTITFVATTALTTSDTITITFLTDTVLTTGSIAGTIDGTSIASNVVSGLRLSLPVPAAIAAGTSVDVVLTAGVTNPTSEGIAFTVDLYTSQDSTAVTSSTYIIDTDLDSLTVAISPDGADTVSQYTITLNVATELTTGANDTISITFPDTTTVPATIADATDVTVDTVALGSVSDYSVSGQTVTVLATATHDATNNFDIVFKVGVGIKNPTSTGNFTLSASTSQDRAVLTSGTYTVNAAAEAKITQIVWKQKDNFIPNDTCSSAFEIETQDSFGNPAKVDSTLTFLFGPADGVFFSNNNCSSAIGTIDISSSASDSADFFYKNATSGTKTLTANEVVDQSWTDASTDVIVNPLLELHGGGVKLSDHKTFAAAISAAVPFDTIKVAPSTYDEKFTINVANLTIESTAGAATTIILPTHTPGSDFDLKIASSGDGAIVKGFTLDFNGTDGTRGGFGLWVEGTSVGIRDNTIELGAGVGNSGGGQGIGITARVSQTVDGLVIDGNVFVGAPMVGSQTPSNNGSLGVWLEGSATSGSPINVTNNTFSGPLYAGVGVKTSNVHFLDNTLTGPGSTLGTFGIGLGVGEITSGIIDIIVDRNTISTFGTGIDVLDNSGSVTATIKRNTLSSNGEGLFADDSANTLTVKYNDFLGNTAGVVNDDGVDTLTIQHNWWGNVTGPLDATGNPSGAGDTVTTGSGAVSYDPWLAAVQATVVTSGKAQYVTSVKLSEIATESGGTVSGGWNTFSTPISLGSAGDTWGEIRALASLDFSAAFSWNGTNFVAVSDGTVIEPLDAIFVQLKTKAQSLPIVYSTALLSANTKTMKATSGSITGWELVGQANLGDQNRDVTLASLGTVAGADLKYSQVIDPISGTVLGETSPDMVVGRGYWVFMTSDATLAGFSTTPVPFVAVP